MEREVAFPSSMVDRITPATTDEDRAGLTSEYGIVDRWPVVSEPFRQWVIEDEFCQGRPPWESAGALITDDVTPYEQLKLRVLNAGHSTLAYLAALAGYELVDQVMEDPWFAGFLTQFLHDEVIPVLPPVPGVDVRAYTEEIIERFSNPAIRDQVSRLCLDGSSKFPTFLMPTIRAQLEGGGPIELSALALAGWCQYLLGKSDSGADLDLAADSKLDSAVAHARSSVTEPAAFLGFTEVFGEVGSHPRIQEAFVMALISLRQHGSRTTLKEWLANGDGGRSV
jgi:mannitol 2-dehydrogenase